MLKTYPFSKQNITFLKIFFSSAVIEKNSLAHKIRNTEGIDCRLLNLIQTILIKAFLFKNCSLDTHTNIQIFNATIEYIITSKRFDESLFLS